MRTEIRVNRYKKSATTANRDALSRGEKAALAVVGSVVSIVMSIWFLSLVEKAAEREAAGRAEMLKPYIEQLQRHEEEARDAELRRRYLYPND